jgi:hypothetical protein
MPLRSKPIGVPLETVEFRFGKKLCLNFAPHEWANYWNWWITWEAMQVGKTYYALYLPAGLSEHAAELSIHYWLQANDYPEIQKYWEGGEACH